MKGFRAAVFIIIIAHMLSAPSVFADGAAGTADWLNLRFQIGNPMCKLNGEQRQIDPRNERVVPYLDEDTGQAMIPIRFLMEAMGIEVEWTPEEPDRIGLYKNGRALCLYLEENGAVIHERGGENVNRFAERENWTKQYRDSRLSEDDPWYSEADPLEGTAIPVAVYAANVQDRTFVPLRAAELFGFQVTWKEEGQAVILNEIPDSALYDEPLSVTQNGATTVFLYRRENVKIAAFYLALRRARTISLCSVWVYNDEQKNVYNMPGPHGDGEPSRPPIKYKQQSMFPDRPEEIAIEHEFEPDKYYVKTRIHPPKLIIFYFREAVTPVVEQTINFEVK